MLSQRLRRGVLVAALCLPGLALLPTGAAVADQPDSVRWAPAPLPRLAARTASDPVTSGPLTVRTDVGSSTTSASGTLVSVTDQHPGSLTLFMVQVHNDSGSAVDVRVVVHLPADGSLADPQAPQATTFSCGDGEAPDTQVCDRPALDPGGTDIVYLMLRVVGAHGTSCIGSQFGEAAAVELADAPEACLTHSPWPGSGSNVGFEVGDTAPNLTLVDEHGKTRSLSDLRGSYVVLTFSSVWCLPSQVETPQDRDEIAALGSSLGAPIRQVIVLVDGPTVGRQSTPLNAEKWRTKFDLRIGDTWATQDDTTLEALQQLGGFTPPDSSLGPGFPTTAFLTPEGKIFHVRLGVGLEGNTTEILENHPAAPAPVLKAAPTIKGTPSLHGKLLGTTGRWTGATDFQHRWLRCGASGGSCTPIAHATKARYAPVKADRGHRLVHEVTAFRRETPRTARSSIGGPQVTHVRVTGRAVVGRTLTGTADVRRAEDTAYRWTRGGKVVGRNASYVVTGADRGKRLTLTVTARNLLGATTRTATSDRVRR